jgi:non-heme chloroperoxidase
MTGSATVQARTVRRHKIVGGGGVALNVLEAGTPGSPSVVFIHGFSQNALAWTRQLESELADDMHLVALDIRGHGDSDKPRDAYGDSRLWADDIQAVIDGLGLVRPVLSGWSYGGLVICDYLASHGESQLGGVNFVSAITRVGEPVFPYLDPDFIALVPGFFSSDVSESTAALRGFMGLCTAQPADARDYFMFLGYNTIVPPYVREGLFARKLEYDALLSRLTLPVLISHGALDRIVLEKMGRHTAQQVRHAKLSIYEGTGHAVFWEEAERFNRELHDFVTKSRS